MPLSINEAAVLLGVSYCTIYREIERGNIPAYKVGGVVRIDDDAISEYKVKNAVQPAPTVVNKKGKHETWKSGMRIVL